MPSASTSASSTKTRNTVVVLLIGLALILVILFVLGRDSSTPATELTVAMNLPLTGTFGIYGQTIRDGALFAVESLDQAAQTPLPKLDIQDNMGAPATTISVLRQQLASEPTIYVSGVKPQTMSIFDQVLETGLPHFVWIFDAYVTSAAPSVFRTWTNYKYEPEKYLEYAERRNAQRIAIACVNVPHTIEEFNQILLPEFGKRGIDATVEIYDFDTSDYRTLVQKMNSGNPDLFILNGFQENMVGLVKALKTYDLVKDGNVIGTFDMLDAAPLLSAEELEGIRVVAPAFEFDLQSELVAWKDRFSDRFSRPALYTDAYSFDMIHIISDAASRLPENPTSADWYRAIQETDLDGVTGRLRFDDTGDLLLDLRVGVYRNGSLELGDR